jgi:hypothetical protein
VFADGVLACAVLVNNTGNVALTNFHQLSSGANCTAAHPVAVLAPTETAVCLVQTTVNDTAALYTGSSVQLNYSGYEVTARGLVPRVAVNAPLFANIQLSNVSGWDLPEPLLTVTFNSSKCLSTSGKLESSPFWE